MMSKTVLMIFIVELLFTVVLMENSMADCGASNTHCSKNSDCCSNECSPTGITNINVCTKKPKIYRRSAVTERICSPARQVCLGNSECCSKWCFVTRSNMMGICMGN
ncbi:uncharacterized protein LOC103573528 [Microplitis demolitor]|uniref:uncharacterized protein LOC103573528 n=1 Tax=Microplitis demolitor TaxID=69319 RepID=UPI0004CCB825|nr:uncharacterized protein LOC103573528 [Microplitis demolitor]